MKGDERDERSVLSVISFISSFLGKNRPRCVGPARKSRPISLICCNQTGCPELACSLYI